jgi:hypothetical protein
MDAGLAQSGESPFVCARRLRTKGESTKGESGFQKECNCTADPKECSRGTQQALADIRTARTPGYYVYQCAVVNKIGKTESFKIEADSLASAKTGALAHVGDGAASGATCHLLESPNGYTGVAGGIDGTIRYPVALKARPLNPNVWTCFVSTKTDGAQKVAVEADSEGAAKQAAAQRFGSNAFGAAYASCRRTPA